MLDDVITNPNLDKYVTAFDTGHTVMVEGDDSQDLFILMSGELDILKGDKRIYGMSERGAIFGEMSFRMTSRPFAFPRKRSRPFFANFRTWPQR
jgi:CRP-like cAMP-binding protein